MVLGSVHGLAISEWSWSWDQCMVLGSVVGLAISELSWDQ